MALLTANRFVEIVPHGRENCSLTCKKVSGGSMIRKYCKAYYLKDLRPFDGWTERREETESDLTDEDVVYLWDDFIVVRSPVLLGGVIFDQVTQEWQDFCHTALQFEIPEDLCYAYERKQEPEESTEEQS
jgi:hypothetical protein